ncbi:MAG: sigma-70 family RNA polymerase sigma factor, partial [Turicibacter sp.]|nr:sigma-70 family RNA polymerase sigma factor [Turicibacter sp.]MBQ4164266.1 sigma-70 family RNA polymerase sigma factor [Turicibacter sp.]
MSLSTHEPVDTVVERLIEQYGQEVYKIAYFYMKETQLAEDVFQEVFYKVIKNYHKFNHQSSEKTWLIRITINTCKDMLRTSWIKRVTTFGVWQDSEHEYEKPYDIEKKETNKELYELIQQLPQKYKEILLLFYYKDLTYEEISEILQIPEGTVRSRLSRAREKLKKMMNERGVS